MALHGCMRSMHCGDSASTVAVWRRRGPLALTCQIGSRSCRSGRHGGPIRPLALSGSCSARLQSELPSDFNRAVCSCRYVLGLVYPAYVTVNALESPGTQDDHHVRFGLGLLSVRCRSLSLFILSCPSPFPSPCPHLSSLHARPAFTLRTRRHA